jgi:ArsR family transcriptional regulator
LTALRWRVTIHQRPVPARVPEEEPALKNRPTAPKEPPPQVSADTVTRLVQLWRLLADESRLKIVLALAPGGEMHVSALCDLVGQTQPAVSHHLTLMRLTGLVGYRRDGKNNFYRLECGYLRDMLERLFADTGNAGKEIECDGFALAYQARG